MTSWRTQPLNDLHDRSEFSCGVDSFDNWLRTQARRQGLGGELLRDALEVIVGAASQAAGRLIVVDAIDDSAAAFYRHYDFQPVAGNPHRLMMKVATARQALSPPDDPAR